MSILLLGETFACLGQLFRKFCNPCVRLLNLLPERCLFGNQIVYLARGFLQSVFEQPDFVSRGRLREIGGPMFCACFF